ncbi:MAG: hypothetical protein M3464_06830 [Chloroflexota bacterium]|nr:hypothetical protein [Chloroflexota bacterium]
MIGTGHALVALWQAAGLGANHLSGNLPPDLDPRYTALVVLTWAMVALVVIVVALLIGAAFS